VGATRPAPTGHATCHKTHTTLAGAGGVAPYACVSICMYLCMGIHGYVWDWARLLHMCLHMCLHMHGAGLVFFFLSSSYQPDTVGGDKDVVIPAESVGRGELGFLSTSALRDQGLGPSE